ncbi:MAG: hypothetical protein JXL97_11410 [Bacteroidales bacterium]|nr:hypothetical protein [Bacteroidales bacterium]
MKKKNLILAILILFGSFAFGQNDTNQTRIGQLTFNYPLGTNGFNSYDYGNNMSINLLVGLNGGVEGVEFGGLGNVNNGDVNGVQVGGILNANKGNVNGAQFAGNLNLNHGDFSGAQISGLVNINTGNSDGIQTAGLVNFNKGDMKYCQASGLVNANIGNAEGLQVAGILNSNLSSPEKKSVQLVQISGLINENASPMKGAQITSILNISADTLVGTQIGLINIGTYVKGTQIGLINIVTDDSSKVVPIGLLSFVKGGVYELEIAGGDLLYANINLKLGVEKLYSIFKIGYSVSGGNSVYSYGFGLGRYFNLNDKNKLSLEISSNSLSDMFFMTTSLDLVNKLDLNYKHSITDNISFFVGPSFNVYVSGDYGQGETPLLKPMYTIAKDNYYNVNVYTWVGANAGIALRF